jgi:RNA polymerase sigma-70 factor (ECF subfamily)
LRHNKVIDKYQKNYTHKSSNDSPEFVFIENEFYDKLENSIPSFSEKQREFFYLAELRKRRIKEIAEQLNI